MKRQELLDKAQAVLESEFGDKWQTVAQILGTDNLTHRVGKDLTSFVAYPERGKGGNNQWRGNCSPKCVADILKYTLQTKRYYGKDLSHFTLLDPMSGSGTSKYVADKFGINSVLYDLNPNAPQGKGGWNALKDDVEDSSDLIFFHPPYHNIIRYSGNMWGQQADPDDLSQCATYDEFIEKLNFVIKKLFMSLRNDGRLAVLVGDVRTKGQFYSISDDMMKIGNIESFIVKGQFNCVSDSKTYKKPFIPIVTEYLWLFHKDNVLIVPFSLTKKAEFNIMEHDVPSLTWHHLIRMTLEHLGNQASLNDLYEQLESHPKAKKNAHWKERIRATIYEHPDEYEKCNDSVYRLKYAA